jgi:PAS domain S-box-containing protein
MSCRNDKELQDMSLIQKTDVERRIEALEAEIEVLKKAQMAIASERRQADREHIKQRDLLQVIIDNIPILLTIWDSERRELRFNAAFRRITGWTESDAVNNNFMSKMYPDVEYRKEVEKYIRSKLSGFRDFKTTAKDGSFVDIAWANVRTPDSVTIGIGVDISKRKRAEEEIKDKLERMVKERTTELDAKNAALLKETKEREQAEERIRKLYSQLVKSQEKERQRISYDLHDNLAQDLFTLKIKLDTFFADQPHTSEENREKISKLSEIVKGTISSIRKMAYELAPGGLKLLGLVPTLCNYCSDFSKEYGVTVDFLPAGMDNIDISFDIQITLYRIVQECLNNIRKHADATHVTIKLVMSFPNIILRIKDNGKGFDVQKEFAGAVDKRQMGIPNIDERVTALKGRMRMESRVMQGTEVVIEIPWRKNKHK